MTATRRCPNGCGARVLTGRCDSGFEVVLDLEVLDPMSELGYVLEGVTTYTHHTGADVIAWRSPFVMRHRPAGTRPRQDVHPAHRCGGGSPS